MKTQSEKAAKTKTVKPKIKKVPALNMIDVIRYLRSEWGGDDASYTDRMAIEVVVAMFNEDQNAMAYFAKEVLDSGDGNPEDYGKDEDDEENED